MTEQEDRKARLRKRRYAAETRFRIYGAAAVLVSTIFLLFFMGSIFTSGYSAFSTTLIDLEVYFDAEILGLDNSSAVEEILSADFYTLLKRSVYAAFPKVGNRHQRRELTKLFSPGAEQLLSSLLSDNPDLLGSKKTIRVPASSDLDQIHKGNAPRGLEESRRRISDKQLEWYDMLVVQGKIHTSFNWNFFTRGDSRYAELAGIGGALLGSLFTIALCFLVSFPIAVATAVYLEEFAPKNRITEVIEININNLAAVPSIIYGLLGLAVILNMFGVPRSTPIAGGIVLSLMTLPVIIIACRAALKAVPPSIRQAAMGIGASRVQVVLHHVLPLALPGTLTGAIIGLSRALGETAPLLMIGMVAFIVDVPGGMSEAATVLPVQIYLWAESAERGFVEKTSAAIMVILVFLICMNSLAVILRTKFQRRW